MFHVKQRIIWSIGRAEYHTTPQPVNAQNKKRICIIPLANHVGMGYLLDKETGKQKESPNVQAKENRSSPCLAERVEQARQPPALSLEGLTI